MNVSLLINRLRELGLYNSFYYRPEIKPLSGILGSDECLNCVLTGVFDGKRQLVAVTDSRVIIIFANSLSPVEVTVINGSAVKSFAFTKKFLFSSAEIVTQEKTFLFRNTQMSIQGLFISSMETLKNNCSID